MLLEITLLARGVYRSRRDKCAHMLSINRAKRLLKVAILFLAATLGLGNTARAEQSLFAPASCCEVARSGDTACPACWAIPTDPYRYSGYYVGGGTCCPYASCPRYGDQGTWGWDYVGYCVKPLVRLAWWKSPHYQGGPGNYAPDGPNCMETLKRY